MEKVSIIVPVYNTEKYLSQCITSLMNQTYSNIEIILIDDGSTDGSLEICRQYAERDSRIVVVEKGNGGVSSARNTGLEKATGEYVLFCDSDDYVTPEWCEKLKKYYLEDTITMCQIGKFISCNILESVAEKAQIALPHPKKVNRKDFLFLREEGFGSPVNKLFKRRVIVEHHIHFPEELSLGEDLAFVLSYLMVIPGDIYLLPDVLYFYRTTGQESLSQSAPTVQQCQLFYEMLSESMSKLGATRDDAWKLRSHIVMCDYEKRLIKIAKDKNLSIVERHRQIKQAMNTKGYRECCQNTKISPNRVYQWMIERKQSILLTLYYNMK